MKFAEQDWFKGSIGSSSRERELCLHKVHLAIGSLRLLGHCIHGQERLARDGW